MTLQLDISAHVEQVREARAAGKGLCAFVVDGESDWCEVESCQADRHRSGFHSNESCNLGRVVPERFRAAAKCETCGGSGQLANIIGWNELTAIIDGKRPCPDCVGGVPVVELVAVCPNDCARFGGKVPGHIYGSNWDWVPCQTCNATTRVLLGRATVTVLPVLDDPESLGSVGVYVDSDGVVWLSADYADSVTLDLDAPPSPGQFVVVVEFTEGET